MIGMLDEGEIIDVKPFSRASMQKTSAKESFLETNKGATEVLMSRNISGDAVVTKNNEVRASNNEHVLLKSTLESSELKPTSSSSSNQRPETSSSYVSSAHPKGDLVSVEVQRGPDFEGHPVYETSLYFSSHHPPIKIKGQYKVYKGLYDSLIDLDEQAYAEIDPEPFPERVSKVNLIFLPLMLIAFSIY